MFWFWWLWLTAQENQKSSISNYHNISISVWTNYRSNGTNTVHFLFSFSSCNHNQGEVCWLTAFHDEGKPQKASAENTGWSMLCQSISMETWLEKKTWHGRKVSTSNRDGRSFERTARITPSQKLGDLHKEWTEAGVSVSGAALTSVQSLVGSFSHESKFFCFI